MATMYTGLGGAAGYGENTFSTATKAAGSNDDGSVAIDVTSIFPGGIEFYGTTYSTIYLNSNGTISFGAADTSYQTTSLAGETTPMLAPFFADVNIGSGGEIYWDIDPTAGTITMTWDGVAPYSGTGNNSFQVQITATGGGDYTVEYIYEDIQWTGDPADTGFTDGGANDVILDGSADAADLAGYETKDFGSGTDGSFFQSFSGGVPTVPDGAIDGTVAADLIDTTYTDSDGDQIDNGNGGGAGGMDDFVAAGDGNDTVAAGAGNDTVHGAGGSDSIDGGSGDDVLWGDAGDGTSMSLNWIDQGLSGTDLSAGFTQDVGGINVNVDFQTGPISDTIATSNATQYTDPDDPFANNSALLLTSDGTAAGENTTTIISFSAVSGGGFDGEVENVTFRINDIDTASWQDQIEVRAFDAEGNEVTINITAAGDDTITGNTITAGAASDAASDAGGSALIDIPGPVARIEFTYSNLDTGGQALWFTDVHFDAPPAVRGDDTISGGEGNDDIYGQDGQDSLSGDGGADTLRGGDGDDTISTGTGADLAYGESGDDRVILNGGDGNDTLFGGETEETLGDTLVVQNTTDTTTTVLTGDGTGTLSLGADAHDVSEFEIFEFTANTDDSFDGSADTEGLTVRAFGGNDAITTGSGADIIEAGSGNDSLTGGAGDDTMSGGDGRDSFFIDDTAGTDSIDGGEGGDDFDMVAFGNVLTNIGVDVTMTGDEAGAYLYDDAGANAAGSFTGIEGLSGTDNADSFDASATTSGMSIDGQGGDDRIIGGTGADSLDGGLGNDSVVLGSAFGNDTIVGGEDASGLDTDVISAQGVTEDLTVTFSGTEAGTITDGTATATFSQIEAVQTGSGDDSIDASADTGGLDLAAGDGADTVQGGTGNDTIALGDGAGDGAADVVVLVDGFGNDIVSQFDAPTANGDGTFTGIDTLDVSGLTSDGSTRVNTGDVIVTDDGAGNAVLSFPSGESLTLEGISPVAANDPLYLNAIGIPLPPNYIVEGTAGGDLIDAAYTGDPEGDRVDALDHSDGSNNDSILGFAGDDTIYAGEGNDTIDGGADNDLIYTGTGNNTVYGGAGNDIIDDVSGASYTGSNLIDAGSGNDTVWSGNGADTVYGGAGNDLIYGEDGADSVFGGDGSDTISGGAGNDTLDGDNAAGLGGADSISGGAGDDEIIGDEGNDTLSGGADNDVIYAGSDNDLILGGTGADTLYGQSGDDTFVIGNSFGADAITGGETGETGGDTLNASAVTSDLTLDLSAIGPNDPESGTLSEGATTASFSEIENIILGSGNDTVQGSTGADTVQTGAGNDVVDLGEGADVVDLGAGDDSVAASEGDTITGGDGDDTFVVTDLGETGASNIQITGGEGSETGGDTLDFNGLINWGDITYTDTNDAAGGLSGYATLADGSVVNFSEIENIIICFTAGTRILTPAGPRPIEDLCPGDLVITADDGVQPIRWIGQRSVPAKGRLAPIRIKAGERFGNNRDLLVSPQHRMLVSGYQANLMFGESEVLATAKHLLNGDDVYRDTGGATVTYVHMLFDRHQIVFAEGAASESFHPGQQGLQAVVGPAREELFTLFPELRSNPAGYGQSARLCLKRFETQLLVA